MSKPRTVVAICDVCVDYAEESAALYKHGDTYRHVGNDRVRCPGQEDDETDDTAEPLTFAQFCAQYDAKFAVQVLSALLTTNTIRTA